MASAEVLALIEQAAAAGSTELDLRGKRLTEIPEEITKLTNLQQLDLSDNQIVEIPEHLSRLSNLQQLNLSGNQIGEIPKHLSQLTNLQQLDLSLNSISEIPEHLSRLTNLQQLNLRENQIGEIPKHLSQLTNLQVLNLSRNQIVEIPEHLSRLSNLQQLNLRENQIGEIPKHLSQLTNLQVLNLSRNQIVEIPEHLSRLSNLQHLNLRENQIGEIPKHLSQLTNLQQLDLSSNQIGEIPEHLSQLSNLQQLNLRENQIGEIPKHLSQLTNLQVLNLSSNQIVEIPEHLSQLTNLQQLYFSSNQIVEIPGHLSQLTNLQQLYFSSNQIVEIPEHLSQLTNLQQLYFSSNQIVEIPEHLSQLTNLQLFDLSSNQIVEIPEHLSQLTNLQLFDLSSNQIVEIPEHLSQLTNLQVLNLSRNQIVEIPEHLSQLTNLQVLYLSGNQIVEIPETFKDLEKLRALALQNNPISIPPDILATYSAKPILDYYFRIQDPNKTTYFYEVKALIVGEGGSGKTSLANKLIDPDYKLVPDSEGKDNSTEGIDILRWEFTGRNNETYRVNVWDFGGQEIYHQTHQFFLTDRSLYLLVADSRKEDTDHYWWLQIVRLLSDASPVLLVQNERSNRSCNLNLRELRAEFDNLKDTKPLNLSDNRGLEETKALIQTYLENLCPNGIPFPNSWLSVRYSLENDGRNYINCHEYEATCRRHGITDKAEMFQLSGFLHSLGVCLHFQNDPVLRNRLILKPNWGTDAVYKILDNDKVKKELGQFCDADLENIWHESEYADMRHELLQLMKEFKVCYEIPRRAGNYIAPHLLSTESPCYDWQTTPNLILRYEYKTFMPKGILTRFIVDMHQYIENVSEPDKALVWKNGVVLKKGNTRAEVIEQRQKREIQIRVSGGGQRDFLAIINEEFEQIHANFDGQLDYETMIPCNCSVCKTQKEPYSYPKQLLDDYILKKWFTITCLKNRQDVDVRRLITDSIELFRDKRDEEDLGMASEKYGRAYEDMAEIAKLAVSRKTEMKMQNISQSGNFGIGVQTGGTIQSGATVAGQINNGADAQDLLKLIESMRQNLSDFPEDSQEDLQGEIDDFEEEASKPDDQRDKKKLVRRVKAIAKNIPEIAKPVAGVTAFANHLTSVIQRIDPAQMENVRGIIVKALPWFS